MTLPHDPLEALNWAWNHFDRAWWVFGLIAAGIAWTNKRMRDWSRRNALSIGPNKAGAARWTPGAPSPPSSSPTPTAPKPGAASAYTAAAAYAANAYTAQAAYAPPPAAPAQGGQARKLHRDTPASQRAVTPVARSVDVPAAAAGGAGAWTLAGAFGDPSHARTAIVIAEVLGRPPGLR